MSRTVAAQPATLAAILAAVLAADSAPAQAPSLVVGAPPGLVSGSTVPLSARLTPGDRPVLSWSLSLAVEGLTIVDATAAGTAFDRLSQGGYAEAGVHPDGGACYSIGVLSFTQPVALPPGQHELLKVRCFISRREPGTVTVSPRDGLTIPGDDRAFRNEVLLEGGEVQAIGVAPAPFIIAGCAEALLAAADLPPGETPPPIEVRRDTAIAARAYVRVASSQHLDPSGFALGIAHDPAVLELGEASLDDALIARYVREDGFARLERTDGGFVATVQSSFLSPASLGVGDHLVARAAYRLRGPGKPGDEIATALALSDDLVAGGAPVSSRFQPRDARPCDAPRLPLTLVVGPDWWVRGDGNADGAANLTDAIVTLQHLFLGGTIECQRAAEVNLDGRVDISDPVTLLSHLFLGAPPPAPPFPACGAAEETLPCDRFPCPAL
jgi:hypothetical protein